MAVNRIQQSNALSHGIGIQAQRYRPNFFSDMDWYDVILMLTEMTGDIKRAKLMLKESATQDMLKYYIKAFNCEKHKEGISGKESQRAGFRTEDISEWDILRTISVFGYLPVGSDVLGFTGDIARGKGKKFGGSGSLMVFWDVSGSNDGRMGDKYCYSAGAGHSGMENISLLYSSIMISILFEQAKKRGDYISLIVTPNGRLSDMQGGKLSGLEEKNLKSQQAIGNGLFWNFWDYQPVIEKNSKFLKKKTGLEYDALKQEIIKPQTVVSAIEWGMELNSIPNTVDEAINEMTEEVYARLAAITAKVTVNKSAIHDIIRRYLPKAVKWAKSSYYTRKYAEENPNNLIGDIIKQNDILFAVKYLCPNTPEPPNKVNYTDKTVVYVFGQLLAKIYEYYVQQHQKALFFPPTKQVYHGQDFITVWLAQDIYWRMAKITGYYPRVPDIEEAADASAFLLRSKEYDKIIDYLDSIIVGDSHNAITAYARQNGIPTNSETTNGSGMDDWTKNLAFILNQLERVSGSGERPTLFIITDFDSGGMFYTPLGKEGYMPDRNISTLITVGLQGSSVNGVIWAKILDRADVVVLHLTEGDTKSSALHIEDVIQARAELAELQRNRAPIAEIENKKMEIQALQDSLLVAKTTSPVGLFAVTEAGNMKIDIQGKAMVKKGAASSDTDFSLSKVVRVLPSGHLDNLMYDISMKTGIPVAEISHTTITKVSITAFQGRPYGTIQFKEVGQAHVIDEVNREIARAGSPHKIKYIPMTGGRMLASFMSMTSKRDFIMNHAEFIQKGCK